VEGGWGRGGGGGKGGVENKDWMEGGLKGVCGGWRVMEMPFGSRAGISRPGSWSHLLPLWGSNPVLDDRSDFTQGLYPQLCGYLGCTTPEWRKGLVHLKEMVHNVVAAVDLSA